MKDLYDLVWNTALPYQDKRDDEGHASVTYEFARQLVELDQGDPEVVFPAIILHDTGWSQLSYDERFVIFSPKATKDDELAVRYKHQDEGVKIAQTILREINYPGQYVDEILEIISQHDTRSHFISHNEGLVRDADKLWRFSKTGFTADIERFKFEPDFLCDKLINQIPSLGFFYSETSRKLAHKELDTRRQEFEEDWHELIHGKNMDQEPLAGAGC